MWGHTFALEGQALWKILLEALAFGAGLPLLFAVGVRSMAAAHGGELEDRAERADRADRADRASRTSRAGAAQQGRPAARLVGLLCFSVVVVVVALGIAYVVATGFGDKISFTHVYPTFTRS